MPIATPQGTLDFKSVDTITFVGASSNTVIDTTTGSLGVGVDGNGPTSNLHVVGHTRLEGDINMLHTANTASIKLNSNVVTEFPRSKKLIKYPRVALTSGQSGLSGGYTQDEYTVEASSELTESGVLFAASNAFNSIQAYQSTDYAWSSGGNRYGTGGLATNGTSKDTFQGIDGSWIGLTLPNAIRLDHVHLYNRAENTVHVCPAKSGIIWASNDGTLWYRILSFDNLQKTDGALNVLQVNSANFYTRYRVQITANNPDPVKTAVMIGELEFYGTPEHDPDADGVDVVVKSLPNVPNTDWLEVYYDAKDLADGAVSTVNDLKPSSLGSAINSSSVTNVSVSDEAFVFNGSSSGINATLSNPQGPWVHSVSVWVKLGKDHGDYGDDNVFSIGNVAGIAQLESLRINSNDVRFVTFQGGADAVYSLPMDRNRWYHFTLTYDGGATNNSFKLFRDGIFYTGTTTATPIELNVAANALLSIGYERVRNRSHFNGSIANFRLFNRALTSDEIYQLYAYQKEYFGHGDLGMTLKAGRLGIGTSEPRAALDVRGDVILTGNFSQIITGVGRVPIMGRISNTFLTTSPSILISDLPENVDIDRMKTAAYGAIVMMSGANISSAGKRTPGKYMGFGEVNQSSTYIELAYGFYDGTYTKIVGLRYDIGSSSKSITVKQTFAKYYQGNTTRYDTVSWTTQGSTPGSTTYGVKDLTIFY